MKFGRIERGVVVEVFDLYEHHPLATSIEGMFHPSQDWREAPDNVAEGWPVFEGVVVSPDHYKVRRTLLYPPMEDLADALAKFYSQDSGVSAEGFAQLQTYSAACLSVKAQVPKSV